MRLVLAGSTGYVGTSLRMRLHAERHELIVLRRPGASGDGVAWDPMQGVLDSDVLERADGVINLCGAGIADKAWSEARKRELRDSRVLSTRTLVGAMQRCTRPPRVLVNASAIGFYGDRGEAMLDEQTAGGHGFLSALCAEWENAAVEAEQLGTRVVRLRIGVVVGPNGGAVSRMRTIFKLGLGGPIGQGRRWMSWIGKEDLLRVIHQVLEREHFQGAVNAVSPQALRNREFAKVLGVAFKRPAFMPVPPMVLSLLYGQMAEETLLCSQRVMPAMLLQDRFVFQQAELRQAVSGVS